MTATSHLETGRSSRTPVGDNLVADHATAEARGFAALARSIGGRVVHEPALGLHLTDIGSPSPYGNVVHLSSPLDVSSVDEVLGVVRAFFADAPGGRFLLFSSFPTPDLSSSGLTLAGHPPVMVRPPAPVPRPVSGLRIERVRTADDVAVFEQTLAEAYPIDDLLPFGAHPRMFGDALADDPTWELWLGFDDDRAVATAATNKAAGLQVVEFVSVHPDVRGRGFGRDITTACVSPDHVTTLVASDDGRSTYEGLGFLSILRQDLWIGAR